MSPVIVIVMAAGINSLLMYRINITEQWARSFRIALLTFFAAEVFCFIGLYLFLHEIFLLVHDLLHIASIFFLLHAAVYFISNLGINKYCPFQVCVSKKGWSAENCISRNISVSLLVGCFFLSAAPVILWLLNRSQPFLGLPEGMTELARTANLLVFPVIAFLLLLILIISIGFQNKPFHKKYMQLSIISFSFLFYSLFQGFLYLLMPSAAIPVEEFLEFFPMVPVFYFLIGKPCTLNASLPA